MHLLKYLHIRCLQKPGSGRKLPIKAFIFIYLSINNLAMAQDGLLSNMTTSNGLSSMNVYSTFCDHKGQIWFCTDKGINLYDGKSVVSYNVNNGLPENEIFRVFEDSQNRLWVSSLKGELFYIQNNVLYTQKNDTTLKKINALTSGTNYDIVDYIFEVKDTVFFSKQGHSLVKLHGTHITYDPALKANTFYCGFYYQNRLYYLNLSGICDFYTHAPVYKTNLSSIYSTKFIAYKGRTYFVENNQVFYVDGLSIKLYRSLPVHDNITIFNFIDANTIMASSLQRTYMIRDNDVYPIRELDNVNVSSIVTDRENNCWLSSLNKGVFLLKDFSYHRYAQPEIANTEICALSTRDNTLYIGTLNGSVYAMNMETRQISTVTEVEDQHKSYIGSNAVKAMTFDKTNHIWIAYASHIEKVDLQTKHKKEWAINSKNITSDAYGNIWVPSYGKISRFSGNQDDEHEEIFYSEFQNNKRKRFYAACHDSQLQQYYFSYDNLFITYKDQITHIDTLSYRIRDIETKNSQLFWILNQSSMLEVYDHKTFIKIPFLNSPNSSRVCNDLFLINDSTLWVAHDEGYSRIRVSPSGHEVLEKTEYKIYNNEGAIPVTSIAYDHGTIYLGTLHGLISVEEKKLASVSYNVPVYITGMKINGKVEPVKMTYALPYNQNNISVDFNGLYYQVFGNINYRYKFSNQEKWSYTNATHLEFPDLSPGIYTLTINASDMYGNWSQQMALVTFVIQKPWYDGVYFKALVYLAAFAIGLILIWLWIRRRHKKEKKDLLMEKALLEANKLQLEAERKLFISQIKPHFIFNSLNSIQNFILNSKPEDAYSYIQKFSKLIRNILLYSKNEMVEISEDIDNVKTYLELEQLRFKDKVSVSLDLPDEWPVGGRIPAMLIQPFIENAIWHGLMPKQEKGNLAIRFTVNDEALYVEISDDGIGREQARKNKTSGTGTGIALTEQRLKLFSDRINRPSSIRIEDLYEDGKAAGTKISLVIPVTYETNR